MNVRYVKIFTAFERFWHWAQTALIALLLLTGFEIHGFYRVFNFSLAVTLHIWFAVVLMVLWVFAIFWHFATGTWRHYVPVTEGLWEVMRFYAYDIFQGQHHPYNKAYWRKHNPLQAIAYLVLKIVLFPLVWISGVAYLLYFMWGTTPDAPATLTTVALIHTIGAFATLSFIIVHLYMLTMGHSFVEHVMPMITGFDHVTLTPKEEEYLSKVNPKHVR
jgi:thiosulfate reductase cytochrome b subunit